MPQTRQPLRKVTDRTEWKGRRSAKLECGHSVEVPFSQAMPYEIECGDCEPVPTE